MSYKAIRDECQRLEMGPLLWALLVEVSARVARKYPPDVYNHGEPWSEEAQRDLALEVVLERLLGENQLEYVLTIADGHPSAERDDALARLLSFQVRRVLNHRRGVTVVDRLYARVKSHVGSDAYRTESVAGGTAVSRSEYPCVARGLTDEEVRQGVKVIATIPRLPSRPDAERESKVYRGADLEELINRLVDAFGIVLLADIRRILEVTLTAWLPTILRDGEEDSASDASPELELERTLMDDLITALAPALDPVQRVVLIGKSQGVSDGEIAGRIGRSRPWVADRKTEVLALVQTGLIDQLSGVLHDEAVRHLLDALALLEEADT